jgi:sulfur-oxidizing protein SoxA
MSPALRALQDDPVRNPGMLTVQEGRAQWSRKPNPQSRSCADCHADATTASIADAAARHPAWDASESRALGLSQRIERCRRRHQQLSGPALDADTGLALQAWLVHLARGKPITPPRDARMDAVRAEGERLFRQRIGQLDLSCAQCHDERAGLRLAGVVVPQAHPTGYPQYRLQWQATGTLERRIRTCMTGVRAQPFDAGDASWVALEAYLMQRAAGMPIESPAVRP